MKRLNNKGFGAVEGLLILVIVALVGGVGYYVYQQNQDTKDSGGSQTQQAAQPKGESEEIKTLAYANPEYSFSFEHPEDWEPVESDVTEKGTDKKLPGVNVELKEEVEVARNVLINVSVVDIASVGVQTTEFLNSGELSEVTNQKEVLSDDIKGLQYTWVTEADPESEYYPDKSLVTIFDTDKYRYSISYSYPYKEDTTKYIDEYNKIVETFKINN